MPLGWLCSQQELFPLAPLPSSSRPPTSSQPSFLASAMRRGLGSIDPVIEFKAIQVRYYSTSPSLPKRTCGEPSIGAADAVAKISRVCCVEMIRKSVEKWRLELMGEGKWRDWPMTEVDVQLREKLADCCMHENKPCAGRDD